MQVRPDLEAERDKASTQKAPLNMDGAERLELMEVLLRISAIAQEAFDILDTERISEADVFTILQLPDWCNKFTRGMERHARNMTERRRNRTSYMAGGTGT